MKNLIISRALLFAFCLSFTGMLCGVKFTDVKTIRTTHTNISITLGSDGTVTSSADGEGDAKADAWNELFAKYKAFILGVAGFAMLTFVLLFIKNAVLLGSSGDNPQKRQNAMLSCLFTGIGAAMCGSVTLITALCWNLFK